MNEFLKKLRSFAAALGSLSVILPTYNFFSNNTPPLFDAIGIITATLSFAFLYLGFRSKLTKQVKIKRNAKQYLLAALVFVISYMVMLFLLQLKLTIPNSPFDIRQVFGQVSGH